MLFRGFASTKLHKKWLAGWLADAWKPWRLAYLSDGWCLTRRLGRRSSNLLASLLANCWVESRSACELAAVADSQACHNHFFSGVWAFAQSFFFRGLVVFAILSSKIALWLAGSWSCPTAWPASLWQLPGCLPGQWTGTPARWLLAG